MNKYERLKEELDEKGTGKMKCFGDSMIPILYTGCNLTFVKQENYEIGDVVFSKVHGWWIGGRFMLNSILVAMKTYIVSHKIDDDLVKMIEDTYAVDLTQRRGINIAVLIQVIETLFKLLDDIDTASDMFKPTWCKITSVISHLQQLRWVYCTVESERNENGDMIINGECFKKEDRIILSLS